MDEKLLGMKFLEANEIEDMECDMDEPYAFISYSHDETDSKIVMTLFKKLYIKGVNLWIDTANMPYGETSWMMPATEALQNHNCKFAFYFRSESSMLSPQIRNELQQMKVLKHIDRIIPVDIWHGNTDAREYHTEIANLGDAEKFVTCKDICNIVSPESKALRAGEDFGNDLEKLAEKMIKLSRKAGIVRADSKLAREEMVVTKIQTAEMNEGMENAPKRTLSEAGEINDIEEKMGKGEDSFENVFYEAKFDENTTLSEFEKICENVNFCMELRKVRKDKTVTAQFFDYFMASLLGGCDSPVMKKGNIVRKAGYNYCKYAVAKEIDPNTVELGASPWSWSSNARKAIWPEDLSNDYYRKDGKIASGKLWLHGDIFAELSRNLTIGDVLKKYENREKGFKTKDEDNKRIFKSWELIKGLSNR